MHVCSAYAFAGAAKRGLTLRTYDVVPLSSSLGMLQFVGGTQPLEAVSDAC